MAVFVVKPVFSWIFEMILANQHHYKRIIAVLLALCPLATLQANAFQSHEGISRAVEKFIGQQQIHLKQVQVRLTSLNQPLRLAQCTKPLKVSMSPGSKLMGNISLAVSCPAAQKWKIYVAAHLDGMVTALIARHPMPRGTVIQESDLEFVNRRYSQLNYGYYGSAKSLKNMEAKRNIKMGQIITPHLVKAQKMVLRGQHITIVAQNGNLNLRVKGKALMDGQQGQTIKVRNLNSKKLIYARVVSAGVVEVGL